MALFFTHSKVRDITNTSNNADKYDDVKKFQEVLDESQINNMMIPDSISRQDNVLLDLKDYVSLLRKEEEGNVELCKSVSG